MQVQAFDTGKVQVLAEYRTRYGEPKEKKVREILEDMVRRHEEGKPPQRTPGKVRPSDDAESPILLGGEHRLLAIIEFNKLLKKNKSDDGPIPFYATVERTSTKSEALEEGAQDNFHNPLTVLDQAHTARHMSDEGATLEQIGNALHCSVSMAGDLVALDKLPKKIKDKILSKNLTLEAALKIGRYAKDEELQKELLETAESFRSTIDAIGERAEARLKAAAAGSGGDEKGESETTQPEAQEAQETGSKGKGKKAATAKKVGKKTPKGRTTGADVDEAAKTMGLAKKKAAGKKEEETHRTKSYAAFNRFLEATFGPKVKESIPEPVRDLVGKVEGWFEGEYTDVQLKNAFLKCCRERYPQTKAAA